MNTRLCVVIGMLLTVCGCSLEDPIDCHGDEVKCVDKNDVGMRYTCNAKGKWEEPTPCDDNMKCDADGIHCLEPEYCLPGNVKCEDTATGGILKTCDASMHWDSGTPCIDNLKCTDDGQGCRQPEYCTAGDTRCDDTANGGILKQCDESGHWDSGVYCEDEKPCRDSATCEPPDRCTPGEVQCTDTESGGILATCSEAGKWSGSQPCPGGQFCEDEYSCTPVEKCTPGTQQCTDIPFGELTIGNLRTCNDSQQWADSIACPGNAACKSDSECGDPTQNACTTQKTECQNIDINGAKYGQLLLCESNAVTTRMCPQNASCKDANECGICTNGTTQCKDGEGFVCQNGEYVSQGKCENGKCHDETRCEKCTSTCKDQMDTGVLMRTCEGSEEPETISCETVSCNPDKTGCGECRISVTGPGTTCTDDENDVGHMNGCQRGKILKDVLCQNGYSCSYTGNYSCGDCHNGDIRCTVKNGKSVLQACTGGAWGGPSGNLKTVPCPNNGTCNAAGTACSNGQNTICFYPDSKSPIATILYPDGTLKPCDNVSCNPDQSDCGECQMNPNGPSTMCRESDNGIGTFSGCDNGIKKNGPCPNNASCSGPYLCAECQTGTTKCEDNSSGVGILMECKNGSWTKSYDTYTCPDKMKCNSDHTFCDTTAKTLCAMRSGTPEGAMITLSGKTFSVSKCSGSHACKSAQACGDCILSMPPVCSGGKLQRCTNGVIVETPCPSGQCQNQYTCLN